MNVLGPAVHIEKITALDNHAEIAMVFTSTALRMGSAFHSFVIEVNADSVKGIDSLVMLEPYRPQSLFPEN